MVPLLNSVVKFAIVANTLCDWFRPVQWQLKFIKCVFKYTDKIVAPFYIIHAVGGQPTATPGSYQQFIPEDVQIGFQTNHTR